MVEPGDDAPGDPPTVPPATIPPATIRCVGAIVHDSCGALLLIRRGREPAAGRWSLPGGHVEPGESDAAALVREVAEETGLPVVPGRLVGTVRRAAPSGGVFEILDFDATPTGAAAGSAGSAGSAAPPVRGGDDALEARWVDAAAYTALDAADALVPGLTDALRSWDRLPRV